MSDASRPAPVAPVATPLAAQPDAPPALVALGLAASLTVADLAASLAWYRDVLGFALEREYRRDGRLLAVALRAGAAELLLGQDDGARGRDRPRGEGFSLQLTTAQGVDALAARVRARGGVLESEPADAWGKRAFRLRDPDGFRLTIASPREGETALTLRPVGRVRSPLTDPAEAPKQGDEGAPEAWIEFDAAVAPGLGDLRAGEEVILLTWLDRADRDTLRVHPRDDPSVPLRGVFSTRSADRPNPVGLHRVTVVEVESPTRLRVRPLEALDGTPVVDVKPVLDRRAER